MPNSLNQPSTRSCSSRRRPRDRQRSRVYLWEADAEEATRDQQLPFPGLSSLVAVQEWLTPVWRSERGRYGLAHAAAPAVMRPHWGQRRALAHVHAGAISLPIWARTPWAVLHELAHHLTPDDEAHGPRFVGVFVGLLARHTGRAPQMLIDMAIEHGVKVDLRSVGCRPTAPLTAQDRLLSMLPATDMDLACELGVHWRQVRGLALSLIRRREARWYRGRLVREAQP